MALAGLVRAGGSARATTPATGGARAPAQGFGPLLADPEHLLDLPAGFTHRIVSRAGETMSDGFVLPAAPDGMAAFAGPDGRTIVVRNHELGTRPASAGAFGEGNRLLSRLAPRDLYDIGTRQDTPCLGATTTFVWDTRSGRLESQHLSLAGTMVNCAGGATPWGSWISCEESVQRAGGAFARDHGWCFEVPARAPGLVAPVPLRAMGRFNHEAVAVDPTSGCIYETEDMPDGLLYRFLPTRRERLAEGGRLQALAVRDRPALDTRGWEEQAVAVGTSLPVRWIDLDDVESPSDDLRKRGAARGASRFARAEGIARSAQAIYFCCTSGGASKRGQIWRYVASPHEGTPLEEQSPGRLELLVQPDDEELLDMPDNLTVAPSGDLVVCEDGSGEQYLRGVTPQGAIYSIARNVRDDSELTGATFSPDGTTLFVNLQKTGLTVAVTGPWQKRPA